jgi:hypothetical protein
MATVFVSGVMQELWPERVSERLLQSDHHIVHIPEVLGLLDLQASV